MSAEFLRIRGGPSEHDIMTWPNPDDPSEVEWRLRYTRYLGGEVATSDLMVAASYMNAYRALIGLPQRARNARIEQIKSAMKEAP